MEFYISERNGNTTPIEQYLHRLEETITVLQATIVQLEYQMKTEQQEQSKETEEAPKSDYDKLKEEIIEEVNLIISDLLWHSPNLFSALAPEKSNLTGGNTGSVIVGWLDGKVLVEHFVSGVISWPITLMIMLYHEL